MSYYIWYYDEAHLNGMPVPHGKLTEFRKLCKKNGWTIESVEKISKDGAVL